MILYNHHVLLIFLGGVFTAFLGTTIVYLKQMFKRQLRRNQLRGDAQVSPESVGDIEEKMNDTIGFEKPNFPAMLTEWSMQPLLIIVFISLFERSSELEIFCTFSLIILILFHELYWVELHAKKAMYQFFVLVIWLFYFGVISYKTNNHPEYRHSQAQEQFDPNHSLSDTTFH